MDCMSFLTFRPLKMVPRLHCHQVSLLRKQLSPETASIAYVYIRVLLLARTETDKARQTHSTSILFKTWLAGNLKNVYWRLISYSPANRTRSPQGFHKTCTLHKQKTYKYNPKVSPFGIALIKMAIKLGDAGTIDHFGLAFQYQIKIL